MRGGNKAVSGRGNLTGAWQQDADDLWQQVKSHLIKQVGVDQEIDLHISQGLVLHRVVWPQTTEGMK